LLARPARNAAVDRLLPNTLRAAAGRRVDILPILQGLPFVSAILRRATIR
jgi:hypothetical protein